MFQSERLTELLPERLSVGKINHQPSPIQETRADLDNQKSSTIDLLKKTTDELRTKEGKNHSWPFICSYFLIEQVFGSQIDLATNAIDAGDIKAFATWYDLAFSTQFILSSVILAEAEIAGVAQEGIDWNLESFSVEDDNKKEAAVKSQEFAQVVAKCLIQDRRGYTVVDKAVEILNQFLKENENSLPYSSTVCSIGAQAAAAHYKAIYPLYEYLT